jgi:hypothetical protein
MGVSPSRERRAAFWAEKTLRRQRRGQRATEPAKRERGCKGAREVSFAAQGKKPRSGKAQGGMRRSNLANTQACGRASGGV